MQIVKLLFEIFLILSAWHDLRERRIPVRLFWLFGAAGICGLLCGWGGADSRAAVWMSFLASLLPGCFLLGFAYFTEGELGAGDGWFFLVSACYLPLTTLLLLLAGGLLFCSALSLGMVAWGTVSGVCVRKIRLPFLPFLLPAWLWLQFF